MKLEPRWKPGFRSFGVKAETAHVELKKIEREHDGQITPAAVVSAARKSRSPLKAFFTWDNQIAGERWREVEARRLLQYLVLVDAKTGETKAPAFVNVALISEDDEHDGIDARSYMAVQVIARDETLRQQALADALAGLRAWERRYEYLKELKEIFVVARRVRKRIGIT